MTLPDEHYGEHYDPLFQAVPVRRSNRTRNVMIGIAVLGAIVMVFLCVGLLSPSGDKSNSGAGVHLITSPSTPVASAHTVAPTAAPVPAIVKPTSKPKRQPVQLTDEDTPGHVGEDFPAGTYRVTQNVAGANCYWLKSKDAEGDVIIDNAVPMGGRPQVTLKKGQWFTSERCGTWTKTK
jgi:hypothetical protein